MNSTNSQSKELRDLREVTDVLANGNDEQLSELELLVDGFPNGKDECIGRYWITHAIDCGSFESVKWILEHKVDLTFCDEEGYTVIHSVLERAKPKKHEILELLLESGASANAYGVNGWTPAHMAAFLEDIESLEILIRHGADLTIRTSVDYYDTPIEEARRFNKNAALQYLMSL